MTNATESCDSHTFQPGDPVWYGGYEHRITAVYPDGHVSLKSDRPGAETAFRGYTHARFVTPRSGEEGSQP
ncbi:hypothetical protein [Nocardia sp. NPDC019255]|uniref:hypothetical protein n=1 Tax=Nocardia sp. NPDC019255 TaxID=3154591 RepID=UPI0033C8D405